MEQELFITILLYIAIPVTILFLLLTILSLFGLDFADGSIADFDGDLDGDLDIQIISFKNILSFIMGLSWGGLMINAVYNNMFLSIIGGVIIGICMVILNIFLIYLISKLNAPHISNYNELIGKIGKVYLEIPKNGYGKVNVDFEGKSTIFSAISNDKENINTNTIVRVVEMLSGNDNMNILIVEKI